MKYLAICLLVLSQSVFAGQHLIIGGWSKHLSNTGLNETNPTLGYSYNNIEVAVMKNSYSKTSILAAYNFSVEPLSFIQIGLRLGVATGYKNTPENMLIAPIVQPNITINPWGNNNQGLGISFGYIVGGDVLTLNGVYNF